MITLINYISNIANNISYGKQQCIEIINRYFLLSIFWLHPCLNFYRY